MSRAVTTAIGYPWLAFDHPLLAKQASRMLTLAENAAPRLIEEFKLTQAEADHNIRILRAIAATWQRIIALDDDSLDAVPPRDLTALPREKIEVLQAAERKARATLETLRGPFWAAMPESWREGLNVGYLDRRSLRAFDPDHFPEVYAFLEAEKRHWIAEALLYNATRWPDAEDCAEDRRHRRALHREREAA
jgi:hypothetical protein